MRTLHLIPSLGGGGAERQLAYLAAEQARAGAEVHVGALRSGTNLNRLLAGGVQYHEIRSSGNYDPRLILGVLGLVRRLRPALLQSWLPQMDVIAGVVSRIAAVPWIVAERASAVAYPVGLRVTLRKLLAQHAAAVVSNSGTGDTYWQNAGIPDTRRHVVLNAVPLAEIDAISPAPGYGRRGGNSPLVLFAGRFAPQKNLPTLVAALGRVLPAVGARALLCGDGPDRAAIEDQVRSEHLQGSVHVTGYTEQLWSLMKAADVFVSISHFEGQPNTVLEAMAARCPLVLSDIPEHREIAHPANVSLVPTSDPAAVAAAIRDVLNAPETARLRAFAARDAVGQRSPADVAAAYAAIYSEVVGAGPRGPLRRD